MQTHTTVDSPVGELTLVNTEGVLSGLYLPGHSRRPDHSSFGHSTPHGFELATAQLREYFARQRTQFSIPTAAQGSDFQRRVWALLVQIPSGQTRTYRQLAQQLSGTGDWKIARAVGSANARNPISIIIPCHRVIGSDGTLTGYAGGLERKKFLLELESPARLPADALF